MRTPEKSWCSYKRTCSLKVLLSKYFFHAQKHTLKIAEQIIMLLYQLKCKPLSLLFPYMISPLFQIHKLSDFITLKGWSG